MPVATFRFHGELNDFLPERQRNVAFSYSFESHQSIKHLIEGLGIPHTEIGSIRVNGDPAGSGALGQDGDRVDVFPIDANSAGKPAVPAEARFILDNHLGKLAAYLRMLGFDALYRNDFEDSELACLASQEMRILLTRDRRLLMRKMVHLGYLVRSTTPLHQAVEVLQRFGLSGEIAPFRRCLRCNGELAPVRKEEVLEQLEPLTRQYYDEFHRCLDCGQIYWKGSHYTRMQKMIEGFSLRISKTL